MQKLKMFHKIKSCNWSYYKIKSKMRKCQAIATSTGKKCRNKITKSSFYTLVDENYCRIHQDVKQTTIKSEVYISSDSNEIFIPEDVWNNILDAAGIEEIMFLSMVCKGLRCIIKKYLESLKNIPEKKRYYVIMNHEGDLSEGNIDTIFKINKLISFEDQSLSFPCRFPLIMESFQNKNYAMGLLEDNIPSLDGDLNYISDTKIKFDTGLDSPLFSKLESYRDFKKFCATRRTLFEGYDSDNDSVLNILEVKGEDIEEKCDYSALQHYLYIGNYAPPIRDNIIPERLEKLRENVRKFAIDHACASLLFHKNNVLKISSSRNNFYTIDRYISILRKIKETNPDIVIAIFGEFEFILSTKKIRTI